MGSSGTCSRPDCGISSGTGGCFEGLENPADCKNWIDSADEIEDEDDDEIDPRHLVAFSTGALSDIEAARQLALKLPVQTVAVIGDQDSGKTTLVAAVYCAFWAGPLGNWTFAGSQSIVNLEQKAHLARMSSGALFAKVERTRTSEGLRLLHLSCVSSSTVDVFFTDRSGEEYEAARATSDATRRLGELQFADRVLYLLDGLRLAHPRYRASAISAATQFLKRASSTGMLRLDKVEMVVTKSDYLDIAIERDASVAEDLRQELDAMRSALDAPHSLPVRYLAPLAIKSPDPEVRQRERLRFAEALDAWFALPNDGVATSDAPGDGEIGKFSQRVFREWLST